MKKIENWLLPLALTVLLDSGGKALASYYEGDEYQLKATLSGNQAGKVEPCRIPKGAITKVIAPLQRYNMIVVKARGGCIALAPLPLE
jgi:hypothetical protein